MCCSEQHIPVRLQLNSSDFLRLCQCGMCLLMQSDLPLWQKYDLLLVEEEGIFLPLLKADVGMLKIVPGRSLRNQLTSCLTG